MSVAQHVPTSTKKQRKPLSAARVYQAWAADVSQYGRRGSFRRTAELVGCSPEYIRQLVAKHEAEHAPKPELFTVHELDYMPAPGEIPLRSPAQPQRIATKEATPNLADAFSTYVKQESDLNVTSCETREESQLATDKQPQLAERENDVLPLGDLPTAAPQMPAAPAYTVPAVSVKHSRPRPASKPPAVRLRAWARQHVNPYMLLALAAVLVLVLAVQLSAAR